MAAAAATEELRQHGEAARKAVEDTARDLQEQIEPVVQRIDQATRKLVEERPIATLVGAVAAGYVLGRLLARR